MKSKIILYTGLFVFAVMINRISAQTTGTLGVLSYEINNGEVTITGCEEAATEAIIPESINESPVTSIGERAFEGCSNLARVTIPGSVISIGSFAFSFCDNITGVIIPTSVVSIGDFAFAGCSSLSGLLFQGSPPNVGTYAFSNLADNACAVIQNAGFVGSYGGVGSDWNGLLVCERTGKLDALSYIITNDGVAITDCDTDVSHVVVPENILGFPVTRTYSGAFTNCSDLETIEMPNTVTDIGGGAFQNCTSLTGFEFPSNVTVINYGTFAGCSSLVNLEIPDGIISIGNGAFARCTSLITLDLPESVDSIGDSAFNGCTSLTSLTLPEELTSIGSWAFANSTKLSSLTVPTGITEIEESVFEGCEGLSSIILPQGITKVGLSAFSSCSSLTTIVLPDGVTYIESNAFENCTNLTDITLPPGVNRIGAKAFKNCSNLESIALPYGITELESLLFSGCNKLTDVTIPSTVTVIWNAFDRIDSLSDVTIPSSVTNIKSNAFYGCRSLNYVVFEGSLPSIGYEAFKNISDDAKVLIPEQHLPYGGVGSDWNGMVVVASSGTIGPLFYEIREKQVTIIDCSIEAVQAIVPQSVSGFPVANIGDFAFYNCISLNALFFEGEAPTVGGNAFLNVPEEVKAVIGNSQHLASFGGSGADWNGLTVTGTSGVIGDYYYTISNVGQVTITDCDAQVVQAIVPETILGFPVTSIGDEAFSECSVMTSVMIPMSVTRIGESAFYNCTSLTTLKLSSNLGAIGDYAFRDSASLISVWFEGSAPNVGSNAFLNTADGSHVIIGDSQYLASFGGSGADWNGLTVTGTSGVIGDYYYTISNVGQVTITDCDTQVVQATVPDAILGFPVTSIGDEAFSECSSLTSVTIPPSITSIGSSAFYNCTSLTSMTIPEGVKSVGNNAFLFCSNLTRVTISASVTSIGNSAFLFCSKLSGVWFKGGAPSVGTNPFNGVAGGAQAFVPEEFLESYGGSGVSWNGLLVSELAFSSFSDAIEYAGYSAEDVLPSADPQNRGVPNAIAYALGIRLTGEITNNQRGRFPKVAPSHHGAPIALGISLPANAPDDVIYCVEVCSILDSDTSTWTEIARKTGGSSWAGSGASRITQDEEQDGYVPTTFEFPADQGDVGFIRMRVEIN